jgi:hypothetical protein
LPAIGQALHFRRHENRRTRQTAMLNDLESSQENRKSRDLDE